MPPLKAPHDCQGHDIHDVKQFEECLIQGAKDEYEIQKAAIDEVNEKGRSFKSWIVTAPSRPPLHPGEGYVIRADMSSVDRFIPRVGDSCTIRFHFKSPGVTSWYNAKRTIDAVRLHRDYDNLAEFSVVIPQRDRVSFESDLKPMSEEMDNPELCLAAESGILINAKFRVSDTTLKAELAALELLRGLAEIETQLPGLKILQDIPTLKAYKYITSFRNPTRTVNLFDEYPHIEDLSLIEDERLREMMKKKLQGFDTDQRAAFEGIQSLDEGIAFAPGGPGGGKTTWSLTTAALIQAGPKKVRVLEILDINKPLDDTADKMMQIYHELGMEKKVIRMHGWPEEVRNSNRGTKKDEGAKPKEKDLDASQRASSDEEDQIDIKLRAMGIHTSGEEGLPDSKEQVSVEKRHEASKEKKHEKELTTSEADFIEAFLREWKHAGTDSEKRWENQLKAPTLDQAAWRYYDDHREKYSDIGFILAQIYIRERKDNPTHEVNWTLLNSTLFKLYKDVVLEADFIAATPVAAQRHHGALNVDIVIFDECAHARELSTLIAVSHFRPKAWFFVGDYRQTRPYTDRGALHRSQLGISMMERAALKGAIKHELLTNHRARGNLQRLGSHLFYRDKLKSAFQTAGELYPPSVCYLQKWLNKIVKTSGLANNSEKLVVPRLIVTYGDETWADNIGTSCWNEKHHCWVVEKAKKLLGDPEFVKIDGSKPGTILIISPYRVAIDKYRAALDKPQFKALKGRIEARTIDTVQGSEADFVFVDMCRRFVTPHMNDHRRLCVALTRAIQAEIILMAEPDNTGPLKSLYNLCLDGKEGQVCDLYG